MMAAASRGLLSPYYKHGIASRAREAMLLTMINMEWVGEALYRRAVVQEIDCAPHYDPKKLPSVLKSTNSTLNLSTSYREYDKYNTILPEEKLRNETEQLVQEYKRFIASGEGERFLKRIQQEEIN